MIWSASAPSAFWDGQKRMWAVDRRQDENFREIGRTQAILKDAIEENGRLIVQSQHIIERHRRRWHRDAPERP
jgi:hypothetical protein